LEDIQFLAEDSKTSADWIQKTIEALSQRELGNIPPTAS
jgi:hypothetical protein